MTFLTALCVGFSFQVSLRSYLKEQKLKEEFQGAGDLPLPLTAKSPVDQEDTVRL